MKRYEIIGRGPSRQAPLPDTEKHWISTAVKDPALLTGNDFVWNVHEESLLEPWLNECRGVRITRDVIDSVVPGGLPKLMWRRHGFKPNNTASLILCLFYYLHFVEGVPTTIDVRLNGVDMKGVVQREQRDNLFMVVGIIHAYGGRVTSTNPDMFNFQSYIPEV